MFEGLLNPLARLALGDYCRGALNAALPRRISQRKGQILDWSMSSRSNDDTIPTVSRPAFLGVLLAKPECDFGDPATAKLEAQVVVPPPATVFESSFREDETPQAADQPWGRARCSTGRIDRCWGSSIAMADRTGVRTWRALGAGASGCSARAVDATGTASSADRIGCTTSAACLTFRRRRGHLLT